MARFCHSPHGKSIRTTTVAQTKTVRGTLAYLPDEYVKGGELGLWIDTYSFGVVRTKTQIPVKPVSLWRMLNWRPAYIFCFFYSLGFTGSTDWSQGNGSRQPVSNLVSGNEKIRFTM